MASRTSVCNQALIFLGADTVVSLEDNEIGGICDVLYDEVRDTLLSERAWSFALRRIEISNKTDVEWGSGYKFQLPSEVLTVHRVYDQPDSEFHNRPQIRDWRLEGRYIVANVDTIYCHAAIKITDENDMPPAFRSALAARMAREIAIPVTHNENLLAAMSNLYAQKLEEAVMSDGRQGTKEMFESGRLLKARY
jgi:hypothetical protein